MRLLLPTQAAILLLGQGSWALGIPTLSQQPIAGLTGAALAIHGDLSRDNWGEWSVISLDCSHNWFLLADHCWATNVFALTLIDSAPMRCLVICKLLAQHLLRLCMVHVIGRKVHVHVMLGNFALSPQVHMELLAQRPLPGWAYRVLPYVYRQPQLAEEDIKSRNGNGA